MPVPLLVPLVFPMLLVKLFLLDVLLLLITEFRADGGEAHVITVLPRLFLEERR